MPDVPVEHTATGVSEASAVVTVRVSSGARPIGAAR
jgi:hypothetical protein